MIASLVFFCVFVILTSDRGDFPRIIVNRLVIYIVICQKIFLNLPRLIFPFYGSKCKQYFEQIEVLSKYRATGVNESGREEMFTLNVLLIDPVSRSEWPNDEKL